MPPINVYYNRNWEEVRISFYFMNVNCKCAIFYGQGFTNDYWKDGLAGKMLDEARIGSIECISTPTRTPSKYTTTTTLHTRQHPS